MVYFTVWASGGVLKYFIDGEETKCEAWNWLYKEWCETVIIGMFRHGLNSVRYFCWIDLCYEIIWGGLIDNAKPAWFGHKIQSEVVLARGACPVLWEN